MNACFMKGWRTLSATGALVVTGLLGAVGEVDLKPVVALFVKEPELLGVAMVAIGLFFGLLRYLTTAPIGVPAPVAANSNLASVDAARIKTDEGE